MKKPKTIAQLKKALDVVFKTYIRKRDLRDDDTFVCISCGQTKTKDQMHAGHFYASTFTAVRWNLCNVNGQCAHCNTFLHGNLLNYRKGMIAKYGIETVERLEEIHNTTLKLDRQQLENLIETFTKLSK